MDPLSSKIRLPKRGFFQRTLVLWLTGVILAEVVASGITWPSVLQAFHALFSGTSSLTGSTVGHAFFVSSELLGLNSSQGIADEVVINLQNIPYPHPGKSYYAWLLSDINQSPTSSRFLGPVKVDHGKVKFSYQGTPQHTNLLATTSRILLTEGATNVIPSQPSPGKSDWRYYAEISSVPNPADTTNHFSLLDLLRHLLSQDPTLELVGLNGGPDVWLFRNTSMILEAADAARDSQKRCTPDPHNPNCALILREIVRILEYLDGVQYARTDVPATVQLDPVIPRVALLEFDAVKQVPPGLLKHIENQVREITISPGVTQDQRALAIRITQDIDNVQGWLEAVRTDAKKLVQMNNDQLSQPDALSILNDMFTQTNYAFSGQFDPNTNSLEAGVGEIYYNIQRLATLNIMPCTISNGKKTCS